MVAQCLPTAGHRLIHKSGLSGGRTWWAHFEFTRINIELTILRQKIEDLCEAREHTSVPDLSSADGEASLRISRRKLRGWQLS